jgi:hypothetical protein
MTLPDLLPAVAVAPVVVQLTMEEYIIASLSEHKAFILHNDVTRECVVIEPAGHRFENLPKPYTEKG